MYNLPLVARGRASSVRIVSSQDEPVLIASQHTVSPGRSWPPILLRIAFDLVNIQIPGELFRQVRTLLFGLLKPCIKLTGLTEDHKVSPWIASEAGTCTES